MKLDQLTAFRAVVRARGFGRAAEELHLTQPAISKQVRALETELGTRLLERGRGVRLTPAGEILLSYADRVCGLVDSARQELADASDLQRGALSIASTQTMAAYLLPRVIDRYRRGFPDVKLRLETAWVPSILDRVVSRRADFGLAILVAPQSSRYPQLVFEPLGSSELIFVAAADHPAARKKVRTLGELHDVPWVLSHDGCQFRAYLERVFAQRNLTMNVAVEVTGMDVLRRLLLLGLGISIVPKALVREDLERGRLRAFRVRGVTPRSQSCIVYRRDKYLSRAMRAFLDLVREAVPRGRAAGDIWPLVRPLP